MLRWPKFRNALRNGFKRIRACRLEYHMNFVLYESAICLFPVLPAFVRTPCSFSCLCVCVRAPVFGLTKLYLFSMYGEQIRCRHTTYPMWLMHCLEEILADLHGTLRMMHSFVTRQISSKTRCYGIILSRQLKINYAVREGLSTMNSRIWQRHKNSKSLWAHVMEMGHTNENIKSPWITVFII